MSLGKRHGCYKSNRAVSTASYTVKPPLTTLRTAVGIHAENSAAATSTVTPGSTAQKAADVVSGARQKTHGTAAKQFTNVAKRWQNHILLEHGVNVPLTNVDVGWMMSDLKRSRAQFGEFNEDDYVDAIGYIDCVVQCVEGVAFNPAPSNVNQLKAAKAPKEAFGMRVFEFTLILVGTLAVAILLVLSLHPVH